MQVDYIQHAAPAQHARPGPCSCHAVTRCNATPPRHDRTVPAHISAVTRRLRSCAGCSVPGVHLKAPMGGRRAGSAIRLLLGCLLAARAHAQVGFGDSLRDRPGAPPLRVVANNPDPASLRSSLVNDGSRPFQFAIVNRVTDRSAAIEGYIINQLMPAANRVIARSVRVCVRLTCIRMCCMHTAPLSPAPPLPNLLPCSHVLHVQRALQGTSRLQTPAIEPSPEMSAVLL